MYGIRISDTWKPMEFILWYNKVVKYHWLSSCFFFKVCLWQIIQTIFLFILKDLKYLCICTKYCNLISNVIYSGFRHAVRNFILRQDNQFNLQVNICFIYKNKNDFTVYLKDYTIRKKTLVTWAQIPNPTCKYSITLPTSFHNAVWLS